MKMKTFTVSASSGSYMIDKKLFGATHVETYTRDDGMQGGHQTLTIFAFYPDDKGEDQVKSIFSRFAEKILRVFSERGIKRAL